MAFKIRSQEYARKVYEDVHALIKSKNFPLSEFSRVCKRFPILVKTNGLMQTIAFYRSKASSSEGKKSDQSKAFEAFLKSLTRHLMPGEETSINELHKLLSSSNCSSEDYMLKTKRALDIGLWYKRYAEILITDSRVDHE